MGLRMHKPTPAAIFPCTARTVLRYAFASSNEMVRQGSVTRSSFGSGAVASGCSNSSFNK